MFGSGTNLNLNATKTIFPLAPMFHVNAWGLIYAGPMNGCKIVFTGRWLDGKSVYELMESE